MITGRTSIIAVIGHPISAIRAPEALNAAFSAGPNDVVTVPVDIPPPSLADFLIAARGWNNLSGFVVTMPHKGPIAGLVDELTPAARASGTVNVVRRSPDGTLTGDQMDGEGFVGSLGAAGIAVTGQQVVLLGAGGVGRSIAFALAADGPARLVLVNRSGTRASTLAADLARAFPTLDLRVGTASDAAEADLLVNATSVGSAVNPGIPIDPSLIRPESTVADVVANPECTALLAEAEAKGAHTHSGVRMQEAQFDRIIAFLL
jgi:shikimate dehydrogenase